MLWFASGAAQAFLVPVMAFTTLLTPNDAARQRGRASRVPGSPLLTAAGLPPRGLGGDRHEPGLLGRRHGRASASSSRRRATSCGRRPRLRADVRAIEERGF